MWERYCRGVQAIVYVVDSADLDSIDTSRRELQVRGQSALWAGCWTTQCVRNWEAARWGSSLRLGFVGDTAVCG